MVSDDQGLGASSPPLFLPISITLLNDCNQAHCSFLFFFLIQQEAIF